MLDRRLTRYNQGVRNTFIADMVMLESTLTSQKPSIADGQLTFSHQSEISDRLSETSSVVHRILPMRGEYLTRPNWGHSVVNIQGNLASGV